MLHRIVKIVVWVGWFLLAIALGTIMGIFDFSAKVDYLILLILGFACFFTSIAIDIGWTMYENKKMQNLGVHLTAPDGNIPYYITETEKLKKRTLNPVIRACCGINIAAAYGLLENYEDALAALHSVKYKKLRGPLLANYWIALAGNYFEAGEFENGLKICREYQTLINEHRNHPGLAAYATILDLYCKIAVNDLNGLEQEIAEARNKWPDLKMKRDFDKLEEHYRNTLSKQ